MGGGASHPPRDRRAAAAAAAAITAAKNATPRKRSFLLYMLPTTTATATATATTIALSRVVAAPQIQGGEEKAEEGGGVFVLSPHLAARLEASGVVWRERAMAGFRLATLFRLLLLRWLGLEEGGDAIFHPR